MNSPRICVPCLLVYPRAMLDYIGAARVVAAIVMQRLRANEEASAATSQAGRKRPTVLETYQARHPTPFAVLGIRAARDRLTGIDYLPRGAATLAPLTPIAERACREIERYLEDPEFRFSLPFDYCGTEFQCRVWREIKSISVGNTNTYKEIARRLGSAPRPVGGACGANRIPILIPCHRVLGSNGLGGFMHARGGYPLEVKRWLLRHEGAAAVMGNE